MSIARDAHDDDDERRLRQLVAAEQARARALQRIEGEQTGSIRREARRVKQRKQARQARKRNR